MKQPWVNRITRYSEEPPDQLLAHPMNARIHPLSQAEALKGVLTEVGIVQNVICNELTGHCLDGHLRISLALRDRQPTVPVTWVRISEDEEKLILATLDPLSAAAAWDKEKLDDLLRDVSTGDAAVQQLLADLAESVGIPSVQVAGAGGDDFDVDEALDGECRVTFGDIWTIGGAHRVCCGDSTDAATVARLMDGERAVVCVTDPPYSVGYENQEREPGRVTRKQQGDVYRDPIDAGTLLEQFIEIIPSDILVMTYPYSQHFHELSDATRQWDMLYECHWVKNHFAYIMGRRYQPRHEPILIFRHKKSKTSGTWNVPNNQSTIFEYDKPAANPDHPTPKPIELWTKLVEYHSDRDGIIYDPFLGSGTTLIAAHRTGRKCYGIEIEPRYASVVLTRAEAEGLSVERTFSTNS